MNKKKWGIWNILKMAWMRKKGVEVFFSTKREAQDIKNGHIEALQHFTSKRYLSRILKLRRAQ